MSKTSSAYKLGELTSDMAAVKRDIVEIKSGQKEILHKIDAINAVSVERWEKRNKYVDDKFAAHERRFEALEDINKLRDSSIWTKIGISLEANFIKFVAAGLLVFALSVAYVYMKNDIIKNSPAANIRE